MKKLVLPACLVALLVSSVRAEIVGQQIYAEADAAKLTALESRAKKEPKNYRVLMKLGVAYAEAGKLANAAAAYGRALDASPGTLEPYHAMALMYIRAARYDEAARVSKAWLGKDPASYYGHFCLADAMSLGGDIKGSLPVLNDLRRRYPSDTAVLYALRLRHEALGQGAEVSRLDATLAEIR